MPPMLAPVVRFAPSPTGFLHIGGARTALFNWLFAQHHGGRFLLRIEDTDRERSTREAIDAILDGLDWLGLERDGEDVLQSAREARHREAALQLLEEGKAYRCYCAPEELAAMREAAQREKQPFRYDGRWRDRDPSEAPPGVRPAIRLKAPREGSVTIDDRVQGSVTVRADQLDDMVILRSDGTPTYMHAVVVDDHDMGITHVIRGDDHFTNAFRQAMLYRAFGWELPVFAHIPLIHGADGAKLSKRHGALSVTAYRDMGYLPEALCNYLLRLGWAHGDEEIISRERAVEVFDLPGIGKSPARFDLARLDHLNGHYLREAKDNRLAELARPRIEALLGRALAPAQCALLADAMPGLKARAGNLAELAGNALFYFRRRPVPLTDKAAALLTESNRALLASLREALAACAAWNHPAIEDYCRAYAEKHALKLGAVAQPLRAALTGSLVSPSVFEVMELLGKEESLARLQDAV